MDQWLETKQFPVHFVSAAGVVYKDGKVLLIRSERRGWEFPGGIVEQGEALLDGLRREILEESGITAEPVAVTAIYQNLAFKKRIWPAGGHDAADYRQYGFQVQVCQRKGNRIGRISGSRLVYTGRGAADNPVSLYQKSI